MTEIAAPLQPLAFLLGRWRGRGRGDYPTIDSFEYEEEVTFNHVGKPFLIYQQRTWDTSGNPLHTESGYVRPVGTNGAELIIAQPTGVTEIHAGPLERRTLRLVTQSVGLSPTAKEVRAVARTLKVVDDTLSYRLDMEAVGEGMQFHLEAELRRE
jgi:hypothetical protein